MRIPASVADLLTMREKFGDLRGKRLAYVAISNNVAKSLAVCCGKLGVEFAVASPPGYEFDAPSLAQSARVARPATHPNPKSE